VVGGFHDLVLMALGMKENSYPVNRLCFLHTCMSYLSYEPWWSDFAFSFDGKILWRKSWLCSLTPASYKYDNKSLVHFLFLLDSKLLDTVIFVMLLSSIL